MSRVITSLLALVFFATPVLSLAQTASPAPAPSASATPDPTKVQELALDVLDQLQNGRINHSLFDDAANAVLTDARVQELQQELSSFGQPNMSFLSTQDLGSGVTVYAYLLRTSAGKFDEIIALDPNGKIAGINFAADTTH